MVSDLGRPAGDPRPGRWAAMTNGVRGRRAALSIRRRRLSIVAVGVVVLVADQMSKTWALRHAQDPVHVIGTLRLFVQFNSGTAFGLGRDSTAIIVAGVVVLVVVLLGLGRRASRTATWPAALAMGLLLGGAVGNLSDRLVRHHHGAVIDFIDLRWWPVFNVADSAITVGAVLLALVFFRARPVSDGRSQRRSGPPDGPTINPARANPARESP